jgi:hypothetical protein
MIITNSPSCYVIVAASKVTTRMVNLSVSKKIDDVPVIEGYAILEVKMPVADVFLDYPLLSCHEVCAWRTEIEAETEGSIWTKIKKLLGIIPLI